MESLDRPEVVKLLLDRRSAGYRPSIDDDGFKIGLAVEGGGMRGVISGAMMIALRDLGLKDVFDGFYGTSSGSINIAYYLNGDTWRALATYYDHLVGSDFVDFKRLLRGGRPVRIDTVLELMDDEVAIDYDRVLEQCRTVRFGVGMSNIDSGRAEYHYDFDSPSDLRSALRAGAWLPLLAGGPTEYRGTRYTDGGAFIPAPFIVGAADGCSHIIQLVTRPEGQPPAKLGPAEKFAARRMNRWQPGSGDTYREAHTSYLETIARMGFVETSYEGSMVYRLACPAGGHSVGRLTMDRSVLLDGARASYQHVLRVFGEEPELYFKVGPQ
jgi:predicted patatin/cPLA2 family phospholipase